jgi:hypothetical protein
VLQTAIDGVPVFVADAPPPVTAGLVFGVGVYGIAVWLLATADVGLDGRLLHTVTGLAVLGLLYSGWQVRPPRGEEADAARSHAGVSPEE